MSKYTECEYALIVCAGELTCAAPNAIFFNCEKKKIRNIFGILPEAECPATKTLNAVYGKMGIVTIDEGKN